MIIVEDADRLTERAADALLKALEEPVPRTVWVLCAPSVQDVVITIRCRSRLVRLQDASGGVGCRAADRRDGVDLPMAMYAARAAQSHVGLARRLRPGRVGAGSDGATSWGWPSGSVVSAMRWGPRPISPRSPRRRSAYSAAERDGAERERLLEVLGADPSSARTQPPHIRSQLTGLEREQKTRATRHSSETSLDRSLVDLLSVYRDALVLHSGAGVGMVNQDSLSLVQTLAQVDDPGAAAGRDGRHRHGSGADRPQRGAAAGFGGHGHLAASASMTVS